MRTAAGLERGGGSYRCRSASWTVSLSLSQLSELTHTLCATLRAPSDCLAASRSSAPQFLGYTMRGDSVETASGQPVPIPQNRRMCAGCAMGAQWF